jgi:hypothetical protein
MSEIGEPRTGCTAIASGYVGRRQEGMMLWMTLAANAFALDLYPEVLGWDCDGTNVTWTVVVNTDAATTTTTFIDLWFDLPAPPRMGEWGQYWMEVPPLPRRGAYFFDVPVRRDEGWTGWVDAIVDTDGLIAETNERNNLYSRSPGNIGVDCR